MRCARHILWGMSSGLPYVGPPGPWESPRRVQNVLSCDTPVIEEGPWSFSCKTRMWWGTDRDTVESYVGTTGIHQDCPRKPRPFGHAGSWGPRMVAGCPGLRAGTEGEGGVVPFLFYQQVFPLGPIEKCQEPLPRCLRAKTVTVTAVIILMSNNYYCPRC